MPDPAWRMSALTAGDDAALTQAIEGRFREIRDSFADEPIGNPALPVMLRALRRQEGWCIFLLLTPWMMARLFVPQELPALPVPDGWTATERQGEPYCVIGPALELTLSSGSQRAHLNHDPVLGHYLIQPLVQAMDQFADADAVFAAWNTVIATRDRVMAETKRECSWQKEVSRREFFSRLAGRTR